MGEGRRAVDRGRRVLLILAGVAALLVVANVAVLMRSDFGPFRPASTPEAVATTPATPTATGTPTPATPTPAPSPALEPFPADLMVLSGARADSLLLTWETEAIVVAGWEYRMTGPDCFGDWGAWTTIPSSGPDTRRYRVTGLDERVRYCFQVRADTISPHGIASPELEGVTLPVGPDGIPEVMSYAAVEGGHSYRVGTDFVIDAPADMPIWIVTRVSHRSKHWPDTGHEVTVHVSDAVTQSSVVLKTQTGEWVRQEIDRSADSPDDVRARFEQMEASLRRVPLSPRLTVTPLVLSSAERGELVLTWVSTMTDVASWEYRVSAVYCDPPWGPWTAIDPPDSAAEPPRLTGLVDWATYCFQIRARTETGEIVESGIVEGYVLRFEPDGIALLDSSVVESGHAYRVDRTGFVIDVPDGLLLTKERHRSNESRQLLTVTLLDVATGSEITLDAQTGEWIERVIVPVPIPPYGSIVGPQDVNALFDQIEASTRLVPRQ